MMSKRFSARVLAPRAKVARVWGCISRTRSFKLTEEESKLLVAQTKVLNSPLPFQRPLEIQQFDTSWDPSKWDGGESLPIRAARITSLIKWAVGLDRTDNS